MSVLLADGMTQTIQTLQEQYDNLLPDEAEAFLICRDCYLEPQDCICTAIGRHGRPSYWPIWHVIQYLRMYYSNGTRG